VVRSRVRYNVLGMGVGMVGMVEMRRVLNFFESVQLPSDTQHKHSRNYVRFKDIFATRNCIYWTLDGACSPNLPREPVHVNEEQLKKLIGLTVSIRKSVASIAEACCSALEPAFGLRSRCVVSNFVSWRTVEVESQEQED
jgi:hypothetical protein